MRKRVILTALLAGFVALTGCGAPTGPGELTEEQQRKGEEEMKQTEDEERGTPVKKPKKR